MAKLKKCSKDKSTHVREASVAALKILKEIKISTTSFTKEKTEAYNKSRIHQVTPAFSNKDIESEYEKKKEMSIPIHS